MGIYSSMQSGENHLRGRIRYPPSCRGSLLVLPSRQRASQWATSGESNHQTKSTTNLTTLADRELKLSHRVKVGCSQRGFIFPKLRIYIQLGMGLLGQRWAWPSALIGRAESGRDKSTSTDCGGLDRHNASPPWMRKKGYMSKILLGRDWRPHRV